jgi:DNA-binding response OmpR family regulator
MPDILVVEDADELRVDLVDYLALTGFRATGVGSVAAARACLDQSAPEIIVLDIGLPDGDGLELAREIRARRGLACGIIMLTGRASIDHRVAGLESGADIYLVKHASMREIDATIRTLLRRLLAPPAATPHPPSWRLDETTRHLVAPNDRRTALTGCEFALLDFLLGRAKATCTRAELIEALARPSLRHNDRNLDGIIRRLRRKIEQDCGLDAPIHVVYGSGYAFTGGAPAIARPIPPRSPASAADSCFAGG